jgi:hypothetical protein
MEYEAERVKLFFGPYCLNPKFSLAEIPIPSLLGTPFWLLLNHMVLKNYQMENLDILLQ